MSYFKLLKENINEALNKVKHITTLLQNINTLLGEIPEPIKHLLKTFTLSIPLQSEKVLSALAKPIKLLIFCLPVLQQKQ